MEIEHDVREAASHYFSEYETQLLGCCAKLIAQEYPGAISLFARLINIGCVDSDVADNLALWLRAPAEYTGSLNKTLTQHFSKRECEDLKMMLCDLCSKISSPVNFDFGFEDGSQTRMAKWIEACIDSGCDQAVQGIVMVLIAAGDEPEIQAGLSNSLSTGDIYHFQISLGCSDAWSEERNTQRAIELFALD